MTIKITGVQRLNVSPSAKGRVQLALVDVQVGEIITLKGCILVQSEEGVRHLWMPPSIDKARHGVKLHPTIRDAAVNAASAAYEAMRDFTAPETPALSAAVELVRQIEAREAA